MEQKLTKIVDYLSQINIDLLHDHDDGRVNSIVHEDQISDALITNFGKIIEKPSIRSWYDIAINDGNSEIFVNIKVSDFSNNAADNISSKLGMGYALTGIKDMPVPWKQFNNVLADNIKIGYDYYFIIMNKNDTKDVFWNSLKRINSLQPNGSNLPFQCNWIINRDYSSRDELSAIKYIINTYLQSWDKKASGYPHKLKAMIENDDFDFGV
jgi:hypothetical protein